MRDKLHTEEVKVRLTEGDKAYLENLSRQRGIPPAVLARTFIKQFLRVASLNTDNNKGSPSQGLGAIHGTQSAT